MLFGRPYCPQPDCPHYLDTKTIVKVNADEYGRPVHNQRYCDELLGGCGRSFLWVKDEVAKYPDYHKDRKVLVVSKEKSRGPPDDWSRKVAEERAREGAR